MSKNICHKINKRISLNNAGVRADELITIPGSYLTLEQRHFLKVKSGKIGEWCYK
jgi:hypothetical protein